MCPHLQTEERGVRHLQTEDLGVRRVAILQGRRRRADGGGGGSMHGGCASDMDAPWRMWAWSLSHYANSTCTCVWPAWCRVVTPRPCELRDVACGCAGLPALQLPCLCECSLSASSRRLNDGLRAPLYPTSCRGEATIICTRYAVNDSRMPEVGSAADSGH